MFKLLLTNNRKLLRDAPLGRHLTYKMSMRILIPLDKCLKAIYTLVLVLPHYATPLSYQQLQQITLVTRCTRQPLKTLQLYQQPLLTSRCSLLNNNRLPILWEWWHHHTHWLAYLSWYLHKLLTLLHQWLWLWQTPMDRLLHKSLEENKYSRLKVKQQQWGIIQQTIINIQVKQL